MPVVAIDQVVVEAGLPARVLHRLVPVVRTDQIVVVEAGRPPCVLHRLVPVVRTDQVVVESG